MTALELQRDISAGILRWYDFNPQCKMLYIGNKDDALFERFKNIGLDVDITTATACIGRGDLSEKYRYIVCIGCWEKYFAPGKLFSIWRNLLTADGTLLIGMNNRFGIKYFCGEKDPYTGRNFDGVENYRRAYNKAEDDFCGRTYDKAEAIAMLKAAGFSNQKFYSVFSDLENPFLLIAEDYLPNENVASRVTPTYNSPDTVFLEEEPLYSSLMENGMFHLMANAYLVECSVNGKFSDVNQATLSLDRGRENAMTTIIRKCGVVEKRAAHKEGEKRLERLAKNLNELKKRGIKVIEGTLEENRYIMDYEKAEVGQVYLKKLLQTDKTRFLETLDIFRDTIMLSSEIIEEDKGDGQGATLAMGYLDMAPINSFYKDGEFVFFDQEFSLPNFPANGLIYRMIVSLYHGNEALRRIMPMEFLFERYDLKRRLPKWQKIEWEFITKLRNRVLLKDYLSKIYRNGDIINANRQRMNYSDDEYQRLFVNIFDNADTRKLILFGSGQFAQKFLKLYQYDYPVYAIIDNNKSRQGEELANVKIVSPDILSDLGKGEYKVIVCIKDYVSVMKQLDNMGVTNYAMYDPSKNYPRKRKPIAAVQESDKLTPKKYHTGYIAGVFDLFHVGHLNLFRRAKELCDYLIVGVVTDKNVRNIKHTEPFIPFKERVEMVKSCRYVDEVVEIPSDYADTDSAWKMHHFDVQFSGSDYENDPAWLKKKAFLEEHGATMVFFPYTQTTSSTKIKKLINEKLI